ncbi:MAG: flagellar basal body rod protein FlgB [Bacteriovoracaceae bacterium]|nr:flagellar basal body rod protein FlgB [Bacteriovoracaceae bacterium]
MKIGDKTIQALRASLNLRQMRQEIIASNIANAETPGYKAKRIDFEEALARALDIDGQQTLKVNDERHFNVGGGGFDNLQPEVYEDANGVVNENGNTVDRERELSLMLENNILYNASVQLLNKKLGMLKYAVSSEK